MTEHWGKVQRDGAIFIWTERGGSEFQLMLRNSDW